MIVLSHPTGNQNVREAGRALEESGSLEGFYTGLAVPEFWARRIPGKVGQQLGRRVFRDLGKGRVRMLGFREFGRLLCQNLPLGRLLREGESAPFSVDRVYREHDRLLARKLPGLAEVRAVYAYEDGALATFGAARERGLHCVYELPIAWWEARKEIFERERERWPQWRATLPGLGDSDEKLARKTEEAFLADLLVVPSRFVLESLPAEVRQAVKCEVVSYGGPEPVAEASPRPPDGPLRFLFVGSMTQRKGLADLFAAMKMLGTSAAGLTVLGSPVEPLDFYLREWPGFHFEAPRPHAGVLELMDRCDVFVLPTLAEGRALVVAEALSRGLPVLTTFASGADDLIIPEETGLLVPPADPDALCAALGWFLEHRHRLPQMRRRCLEMMQAKGWPTYRSRLVGTLRQAQILPPLPFP